MENVWYARIDETPIDHLWAAVCEDGLVAIKFRGSEEEFTSYVHKLTGLTPQKDESKLKLVFQQLSSYFSGNLKVFDLPICWSVMTEFQQKALNLVYSIPYGQLRTYGDIALALGDLKAIRAVGRANATNPIPLVIPCHRVIGADGKLTGFAGGIETKAWL